MNIRTPMTDDTFIAMVKDRLGMVSAKHGHKYNSPEELRGVLGEEYDEVKEAIRAGRGEVTTDVLSELVDIAVVCVRGARGLAYSEPGLHGLYVGYSGDSE